MSDDDYFEHEDDELEGSQEEVLRLRALVETVKGCPALYAKNKKEYCGRKFNKDLAWTSIGTAQVPPVSGEEASRLFYKVRQRFGKEWRRKQQHMKGKSGQGDAGVYRSNWPLFADCMFLQQHIQPRKTSSTYFTKPIKSAVTERSSTPGSSRSSSVPLSSPSPTDSFSTLWSTDMALFRQGESEVHIASDMNDSSPSPSPRPSEQQSASEKIMKAMQSASKAPKRSAPEPDTFASKRKKTEDDFLCSLVQQGNELSSVAKSLSNAIQAPRPPEATTPQDPMLVSIQFALASVPEEKKLECLVAVLNLIQNNFAKK